MLGCELSSACYLELDVDESLYVRVCIHKTMKKRIDERNLHRGNQTGSSPGSKKCIESRTKRRENGISGHLFN